MVNSFNRLRHNAVVGSNYQHHNIRDFSTAGAHGGKGGVARCVYEGNLLPRGNLDLISTDVLRNATGLALGHISGTKGVQQRGLAVVDMSHNRHDGRAIAKLVFGIFRAF